MASPNPYCLIPHFYFDAVSWPAEKTSLVDEGWYRLIAILYFLVLNIQTQHSWFWDFEADKTFSISWSGYRVQVWAQVWAPADHLALQKTESQQGFDDL